MPRTRVVVRHSSDILAQRLDTVFPHDRRLTVLGQRPRLVHMHADDVHAPVVQDRHEKHASSATASPVMHSVCECRCATSIASTRRLLLSRAIKLWRVAFRRRMEPSCARGPKSCCSSRLLFKYKFSSRLLIPAPVCLRARVTIYKRDNKEGIPYVEMRWRDVRRERKARRLSQQSRQSAAQNR